MILARRHVIFGFKYMEPTYESALTFLKEGILTPRKKEILKTFGIQIPINYKIPPSRDKICQSCLIKLSYSNRAKYCLDCKKKINRLSIKIYNKDKLQGRDYNRESVRIRDSHRCQDCGKKWIEGQRRFDVHHLDGLCGKKSKGYDKAVEIDGLVTLCHKCHFNRPEHRIKSKKLLTV